MGFPYPIRSSSQTKNLLNAEVRRLSGAEIEGDEGHDGHGGSCSTEVLVSVDKSQGKKGEAVDGGALYDSTVTP